MIKVEVRDIMGREGGRLYIFGRFEVLLEGVWLIVWVIKEIIEVLGRGVILFLDLIILGEMVFMNRIGSKR